MDFSTAVLVVVLGTTIILAALYWEGGHSWALDPPTTSRVRQPRLL
jgi:hypothetical protein